MTTKNMAMAAAVFLTQTALLIEDRLNRPTATSPTPAIQQLSSNARNPREICETVRRQVSYKDDPTDQWQTGEETLRKRTGDCEDFAAGVREMCHQMGYDAQIVVLVDQRSGRAHAVAQGEYAGSNWVSSNGNFEWTRTPRETAELQARMMGTTREALQAYTVEPPDPTRPNEHALALASPAQHTISPPRRRRQEKNSSSALTEYDSYYHMPYSDVEALR